jgi:hypothetical protein
LLATSWYGFGGLSSLHEFGYAKVKDLGFSPSRNKDVGWLDVAMDNAFLMRSLQPVSNLDRDLRQLLHSSPRFFVRRILDPFP